MLRAMRLASWAGVGVLCGGLCLAGSASAYQTIGSDWRINEFPGALPGTTYSTAQTGVDYDAAGSAEAHPGEAHVAGDLTSLNYHTTGDPGTNVNHVFSPALDFTLEMEFLGYSLTQNTGACADTCYDLQLDYGTNGGGPDLVVTDPSDGTQVLLANLVAGTFFGQDVEALEAKATIDFASLNKNQTLTYLAFMEVLPSPYASLFTDAEYIGFQIGQVLSWEIDDADGQFDFDNLALELQTNGVLQSHTAETNGFVYGISSSSFTPIPEPGTALLMGIGLLGLAAARRRA